MRIIATLATIGTLITCMAFPTLAESDTHVIYAPAFDICQLIYRNYRNYSGPLSYVEFVYPCVMANRIRV